MSFLDYTLFALCLLLVLYAVRVWSLSGRKRIRLLLGFFPFARPSRAVDSFER